MGHLRKRYLESLVVHAAKLSPLVGVLGHRQVGKTTLLENCSKGYITFDDLEDFEKAKSDSKKFISEFKHLHQAIDECQLVENIFPALKERVRKDKRPGQFFLSGSVRFTSKKLIQESLTGRILTFDLLPFTISEILSHEPPQLIRKALQCQSFLGVTDRWFNGQIKVNEIKKELQLYYHRGGLPGIFFVRNEKLRKDKMNNQIQTILDRDIRTIYPTTLPFISIFNFLKNLANHQGQILNHSNIRRELGLSLVTQKKLLFALEAVFLIRAMEIRGDHNGVTYYLEDQGESLFLAPIQNHEELYEQLVYRNFRAEIFYELGGHFSVFQYLTRGKARMPFVVQSGNSFLGILPILENEPSRTHMASIYSFLKKFNNSKVLIVSESGPILELNDRILQVSVAHVV